MQRRVLIPVRVSGEQRWITLPELARLLRGYGDSDRLIHIANREAGYETDHAAPVPKPKGE